MNSTTPCTSELTEAQQISPVAEPAEASDTVAVQPDKRIHVWIALNGISPIANPVSTETWEQLKSNRQAEIGTVRTQVEQFILEHDNKATFGPGQAGEHLVPVMYTLIRQDIFQAIYNKKPENVEVWGVPPPMEIALAGS